MALDDLAQRVERIKCLCLIYHKSNIFDSRRFIAGEDNLKRTFFSDKQSPDGWAIILFQEICFPRT